MTERVYKRLINVQLTKYLVNDQFIEVSRNLFDFYWSLFTT